MSQLTQNVHGLGYAAGRNLRLLLRSATPSALPPPPPPPPSLPSISDVLRAASDALSYASSLPPRYRRWWMKLVEEDPIHVLIETVLILFVLYMALSRRAADWRGAGRGGDERLSEEEREELLREWKERGRAGLVPTETGGRASGGDGGGGGVGRRGGGGRGGVVVERVVGPLLVLRGEGGAGAERTVLNFATHDFLGMASSPDDGGYDDIGGGGGEGDGCGGGGDPAKDAAPSVKSAARSALERYGCGSCGPRGFYGTIDAHLELEDAISSFTGTEGAIMYSDGASACTSTVAAFAKRGDLLVVDECVYEALGTGVTLSRANVKYFRHNDVEDLRRVLERVRATDESLGRRSRDMRRFIVVEGLYRNYGTVAPLDEIVALKHEFSYRLILDESFSFGTMGPTGRGAIEHFGLRPMVDAEIVTISLENSLGSIGGVTVGNEEVVDHQRLSGAGYCFSASAPPFVASAAVASLGRMRARPEILERLRENRERVYAELDGGGGCGGIMRGVVPDLLVVSSDRLSPIVFLRPAAAADDDGASGGGWAAILDAVAARCLDSGLAVVSAGGRDGEHMHVAPPPALRLTVSAAQSAGDVERALRVLRDAALEVMGDG